MKALDTYAKPLLVCQHLNPQFLLEVSLNSSWAHIATARLRHYIIEAPRPEYKQFEFHQCMRFILLSFPLLLDWRGNTDSIEANG